MCGQQTADPIRQQSARSRKYGLASRERQPYCQQTGEENVLFRYRRNLRDLVIKGREPRLPDKAQPVLCDMQDRNFPSPHSSSPTSYSLHWTNKSRYSARA